MQACLLWGWFIQRIGSGKLPDRLNRCFYVWPALRCCRDSNSVQQRACVGFSSLPGLRSSPCAGSGNLGCRSLPKYLLPSASRPLHLGRLKTRLMPAEMIICARSTTFFEGSAGASLGLSGTIKTAIGTAWNDTNCQGPARAWH